MSDALALLMRVHYRFFMANPRFWYDKDLQAADTLIVVRASQIRFEAQGKEPRK